MRAEYFERVHIQANVPLVGGAAFTHAHHRADDSREEDLKNKRVVELEMSDHRSLLRSAGHVQRISFDELHSIFPARQRPYCEVLSVPARGSFTDGAEAAEFATFARYLRSSCTALPNHPSLRPHVAQREDYDTYVGEEVWANALDQPDESGEEDLRLARHSYSKIVFQLAHILERVKEKSITRQAVLAGRTAVADDCAWSVSSRAVALNSLRDVFMAMRMSNKFVEDCSDDTVPKNADSPDSGSTIQIRLVEHLSFEPSSEFRVFILFDGDKAMHGHRDGTVLGISQRHTDQVFPHLALLSSTQRCDMFKDICHAVALKDICRCLPRNCAEMSAHSTSGHHHRHHHALLAVDVVHENARLPTIILSAKVLPIEEVFPASESHEKEKDGSVDDDPLFFRFFRSLSGLMASSKSSEVLVADESAMLCADMSSIASGLPIELQNPQDFLEQCRGVEGGEAAVEMMKLLRKMQEEQVHPSSA